MLERILISLLFVNVAWAGGLTAPYDMDSASVLPKNVRSPRYKNILTRMESKYDNAGVVQPLGAALNKSVTFGNLVDAQSMAKDKALAEGTITANGFSLADNVGTTTGQVNTFVDIKVPYFAYGLTERDTLAFVIPVYDINIEADTGFVASTAGQTWLNSIDKSNPEKAVEIQGKINRATNQKLIDSGYKPIQSERYQAIGDVKFVWKHQYLKNERNAFTIKYAVTAPTGTHPDADKVVDTATGDGQWDVGVRALWDVYATSFLSLNSYVGYTAQLPDELERRIPEKRGDTVSKDKGYVYRDLGDQSEVALGLTGGDTSDGLSASTLLSYQYMEPTRFHGVGFSSERYGWLSESNPAQDLAAVTFGGQFSTIGAYREGRFALPMQVNAYVGHPLAGRNVSGSDIYSAELVLFF